jgi:DNA invertase Pin-like site-specific DNA recombinase
MSQAIHHPKIRPEHVRRKAIVYIRQSSPHQVRDHRESTARQYALVERAKALGWPTKSIETIDEDQGRTSITAVHRHGFKKSFFWVFSGKD